MKTKAMRTKVLTQSVILTNIARLKNSKDNRHTANRLRYWLTRQKMFDRAATAAKKGPNVKA